MASPRVVRGRNTEELLAADLRACGAPDAETVGASRPGRDIKNWLGVAPEVKARRGLNILAALRQAAKNAAGDYPLVVARFDGQGPDRINEWVAMMSWKDMKELFKEAGYLAP